MNKEPSFKQQWVLSMTDTNLLYVGHLYTNSLGPFCGASGGALRQFLKRMEQAGWLEMSRNRAFYNLTLKAMSWKKVNSKKDRVYYYNEYRKNLKLFKKNKHHDTRRTN